MLIPLADLAQTTPEWVNAFQGISNDGLQIDQAGNCYVLGHFQGDSISLDTSYLVGYSSDGIQQWVRKINGIGPYQQLAKDDSNNVYISTRISNATTFYNFFTQKYSPAGNLTWSKEFNSIWNNQDAAHDIKIDHSGNVYVLGESKNDTTFDYEISIIKYNAAGNEIWTRYLKYPNDNGRGISLDVDIYENAYLLSWSQDIAGNTLITKVNKNGDIVWDKRFFIENNCVLSSIKLYDNNQIYALGNICDGQGGSDIYLIKLDSSGGNPWSFIYDAESGSGNNGQDIMHAMAFDTNGDVILAGEKNSGSLIGEMLVVKVSKAGDLMWAEPYSGNGKPNGANDVEVGSDGKIYAFGWNYSSTLLHNIFCLLIYNGDGDLLSVVNYFLGENYEVGSHVELDALNNIYASGSFLSPGNPQMITMKYGTEVGITSIADQGHVNIFPTPSSGIINIESTPSIENCTISVMNMFGQLIEQRTIQLKPHTKIDLTDLAPGEYILKIMTSSAVYGEKLMIIE